jgi:hypothetical protein
LQKYNQMIYAKKKLLIILFLFPLSALATNYTWDNTNGNILMDNSLACSLRGGDTVFIPPKSGGYRSFTISGLGTPNEGSYIVIYWQPGAYITPTLSPIFANSMDKCYWVHVYGWVMNDNIDVAFTSYAKTGYSQHIWFDHCTFIGMNGFFPSSPQNFSLPEFTGDTINCFYWFRWSNCTFDSLVGENSGNTALWFGAIGKNQTWVHVEIDHDKFGDYSSLANPACYIHAMNVYGLYIHDDSLWNLGKSVPNPNGHAAMLFFVEVYFEIYRCYFGPANFANCIRNNGCADIPSMSSMFVKWSKDYTGRSRIYNCIDDNSRKYPFLETRTDPGDINALAPYVRMRTGPEVWNCSARQLNMAANNEYYNSSLIDCYETDSLFLKNSFIVGPTDMAWNHCDGQGCNALITTPAGAVAVWDTASNRFLEYSYLAGFSDSVLLIPSSEGQLYNTGLMAPGYISGDYYGRPRNRPCGSSDIGAVQSLSLTVPTRSAQRKVQ